MSQNAQLLARARHERQILKNDQISESATKNFERTVHWLVRDPRAHYQQTLDVLKHAKVQYVQKFLSYYINLVIFGNRLAGSPVGLVLLGNFENFDFFILKTSKNDQISAPDTDF